MPLLTLQSLLYKSLSSTWAMNKWTWHDIKKKKKSRLLQQKTTGNLHRNSFQSLTMAKVYPCNGRLAVCRWFTRLTFNAHSIWTVIQIVFFFNLIIYEATVQKHTMERERVFFLSRNSSFQLFEDTIKSFIQMKWDQRHSHVVFFLSFSFLCQRMR